VSIILMFAALLAGTAIPLQAAINGKLRLELGSSAVAAALVSFLVGTIVLFLAACMQAGALRSLSSLPQQPLWKLLGGPLGAFFIFAVTFLTPRLGLAALLSLVIAGQILTSMAFDHFGLFGLVQQKIMWPKVLGGFLIIAGVVVVNFSNELERFR
jgi:transporter family-2 protein